MVTETRNRPWPRVKWTRAGQVLPLIGAPPGQDDLDALTPADAFAALRTRDPTLALNFMAHCLPRHQAVRWLVGCLAGMTDHRIANRLAATKAVNRWVAEPSDSNRRLAYAAGEAAGFDTAEGMACLAVFLSGGSLAPPTQEQAVPSPPAAFGQSLAGAIMLATLDDDPVGFGGRMTKALDVAEQLAASGSEAA